MLAMLTNIRTFPKTTPTPPKKDKYSWENWIKEPGENRATRMKFLEKFKIQDNKLICDGDLELEYVENVSSLPPHMKVTGRIDLTGWSNLTSLPIGLEANTLILTGCKKLTSLPEDLAVQSINLRDCEQITSLPNTIKGLKVLYVNKTNLQYGHYKEHYLNSVEIMAI